VLSPGEVTENGSRQFEMNPLVSLCPPPFNAPQFEFANISTMSLFCNHSTIFSSRDRMAALAEGDPGQEEGLLPLLERFAEADLHALDVRLL